MNSFYTINELKETGLNLPGGGKNVLISKKASIYGAENITIANNVRVDDFCILSGKITVGEYVHIAAHCVLFGGEKGIVLENFSGVSSRCAIYAESDDYSGNALTNPTVANEYRNVLGGQVVLRKHVIVGTGSCILPGVDVGEGTAVGSMSLVTRPLEEWSVYAGIPCKRIKDRSKKLLELEKDFLEKNTEGGGKVTKYSIGQTASFSKTISECDVYGFAGITGDFNDAHINKAVAEQSMFKKQIVHGMLTGSLISAVLGTKLPGPETIYMEQKFNFLKPVYFGDTVTAMVKILEILPGNKAKLETIVSNQNDEIVISGYALVKLPN